MKFGALLVFFVDWGRRRIRVRIPLGSVKNRSHGADTMAANPVSERFSSLQIVYSLD